MRFPARLETVSIEVPQAAVEWYERALQASCSSVAMFLDEGSGRWRIEGIRQAGRGEDELQAGLVLAQWQTGIEGVASRNATPSDGWLARTRSGFPEQRVGRRFAIRGSHLPRVTSPGRICLRLDAGVAFGSGEHASTQGCLLALERLAYRRPRRILDLGTGSGVLAMAASRLLKRRVVAADIDPWSVRVSHENARDNGLSRMIECVLANGWQNPRVRQGAPYDLVFANILARPLCAMAAQLAAHLRPGGTAVLAGLLATQARQVAVAHRRAGLRLEAKLDVGAWTTLILRRAGTVGGRP